MPVHVSIYLYLISVFIILYCSLHGGPPWTQGEAKRFQGQRPFWVVVPFLTTLYIPNHLAYWSGLEETRAPNTAISPGTKAEKATTPVVPSPTRIAGRCGSARGASSDPGPLSCLFFELHKTTCKSRIFTHFRTWTKPQTSGFILTCYPTPKLATHGRKRANNWTNTTSPLLPSYSCTAFRSENSSASRFFST